MSSEIDLTRVVTPTCRLSFPHLFVPREGMKPGDKPRYCCELILPDDTSLHQQMKDAAMHVAKEFFGDKLAKVAKQSGWKNPFRDGSSREDVDGYEGKIFVGAWSYEPVPICIGRNRRKPLDESEIYGGCFVRATLRAFAFDKDVNRGVGFCLNGIWKIRDGEPFASKRSAEEDFAQANVDDAEFDEDSYEDAEGALGHESGEDLPF